MCKRLRTGAIGHLDHGVQSGQSGCPSKGYLRQPGDTSRTRLPRAFPSTRTLHAHIYCSIFSNTIFCLSNPPMSNAPFLLWEQGWVSTNPHSNIFSELGSLERVKAAECVPHVPTVEFWHALNYKTVEMFVQPLRFLLLFLVLFVHFKADRLSRLVFLIAFFIMRQDFINSLKRRHLRSDPILVVKWGN